MTVRKIRRRVFNFKKFFCFLLFLGVFVFIGYYFSKQPIKNIVVLGNNYISDEEIIELIYEQLHKGSSNKAMDIIEKGGLELYVT